MSRLSRLGYIDVRRTDDPVRRRVRPRGVPVALRDHEVFYTEHPDEAETLIGRAFAPCRLSVDPGEGFAASLHGIRLRDVSLLYLDLHVPVHLELARCGSYYGVHMSMGGLATGQVAGTEVEVNPIRAAVTNPGDAVHLRMELDSPQLIVRIERAALERHLTWQVGHTLTHALTFEPVLDLTTDAATRWHNALQVLHTEVFHAGSLLHAGIGIGPVEDFLMSSLLMLQPSTYRTEVTRPAGRPARRAVRRAREYIEAHLSEPLTVADIAGHAGASVRAVQQAFHDELGLTPMAYLRERRLERARAELIDAVPEDGITVTRVAEHWGFTHLSSFAGQYRERWGETPSQTLRR